MHIVDGRLFDPTLSIENELCQLSIGSDMRAGVELNDGVDFHTSETLIEDAGCCNCAEKEELSTALSTIHSNQQNSDNLESVEDDIECSSRINCVQFSHVELREYALEIDSAPNFAFSGPAMTMGWSYTETKNVAIDIFESTLKRHQINRLTCSQRKNLLRVVSGFSEVDFRRVCGNVKVLGGKKMHRHSRSWDDLSVASAEALASTSTSLGHVGLFADI